MDGPYTCGVFLQLDILKFFKIISNHRYSNCVPPRRGDVRYKERTVDVCTGSQCGRNKLYSRTDQRGPVFFILDDTDEYRIFRGDDTISQSDIGILRKRRGRAKDAEEKNTEKEVSGMK